MQRKCGKWGDRKRGNDYENFWPKCPQLPLDSAHSPKSRPTRKGEGSRTTSKPYQVFRRPIRWMERIISTSYWLSALWTTRRLLCTAALREHIQSKSGVEERFTNLGDDEGMSVCTIEEPAAMTYANSVSSENKWVLEAPYIPKRMIAPTTSRFSCNDTF